MELKEFIRFGQRIQSFIIEVENSGKWQRVFKGSAVGHKKLAQFEDVKASKVRITFIKCVGLPDNRNG